MKDIEFPEGTIYPDSVVHRDQDNTTYFLARIDQSGEKRLGIMGRIDGFAGRHNADGLFLCPLSAENAAALRTRLAWLNPRPLGLWPSFGFGDRLGWATPGHIQAMRTAMPDGAMAPIFAQQSVRENTRLGHTPQQVMDAAMWGVFQAGWRQPWGADADHVKAISDLAAFVAAGYTFFTLDPSDHVDNAAQTDPIDRLRQKVARLPWAELETTLEALQAYYCQTSFSLAGLTLHFDEEILLRALGKYGAALAHSLALTRNLAQHMAGQPFDLELSVDETDTPTSIYEHFLIAHELYRRDIPLTSLALRFSGKFQKGVDYMGDIKTFEADLVNHSAIMRHFDRYKLSVHTGSDKFSIYPILAHHAGERLHVKTAGTSYLEALRLIARGQPAFFRTLLALARTHFETDRHSYDLDCQPDRVPAGSTISDTGLPDLLEQFDARQLLHVTFGSILAEHGPDVHAFINHHETAYLAGLTRHFERHLAPFSSLVP